MKKLKLTAVKALFLYLLFIFLVGTSAGQSTEPPYPDAEPLPVDQKFYSFVALTNAKRANVSEEMAKQTFNEESFTTPESVESVLDYLDPSGQERLLESTKELESGIHTFIGSLNEGELSDLVELIGSDLSGEAYRTTLLKMVDLVPGGSITHGLAFKADDDGKFYYYDLHRPYLDFTRLEWVDATRIRVVQLPFDPR